MTKLPLDGLQLLILEDEFLIALDVEQICREYGAAGVTIIRNLNEVVESSLASKVFHAAILDLMLAGQKTTDFARRLRERAIPFVFATGYVDTNLLDGFDGVPVVGKPYSSSDIIEALVAVISHAEGQQSSRG